MRPSPRLLPLVCLLPLLGAPAPASAQPGDAFERLYFSGDELVESATRSPKPLSQVAENVTVITADEIRDMNAHTLAEVLARVPGIFPEFLSFEFGGALLAHIQGSGEPNSFANGAEELHVTVLVDGMRWNSTTSGPYFQNIPVQAVERIEIVKGPASSTWGSSLGGVINVITKATGKAGELDGTLSGSYGEQERWDLRGEVAGGVGPMGGYLQAQAQHADWRGDRRGFDNRNLFAKVSTRLGEAATLTLSGLTARPEIDALELPDLGLFGSTEVPTRFGRAALDTRVGPGLTLHAAAYRFEQEIRQPVTSDGTWNAFGSLATPFPEGQLVLRDVFDETHQGAQGRATWQGGAHTVVLGADFEAVELDQESLEDFGFGGASAPAVLAETFDFDTWGVYLNDTVLLGPLALTPGLRYDDSSRTDPFWSPSLGAACRVGRETVLRALVARGFTLPAPSALIGSSVNQFAGNPGLDPEQVWSYQAGAETSALRWVWLKATLFRHEVTDAFVTGETPDGGNIVENAGWIWRTGAELEAQTAPWHGLAFRGGFSYVKVEVAGAGRDQDQYASVLGAYYTRGPWHAQLAGNHVWWDYGGGAEEGRHNDPLFDLNLRRTFFGGQTLSADLFLAAHNLFNGDQYVDTAQGTNRRWLEAGARVQF